MSLSKKIKKLRQSEQKKALVVDQFRAWYRNSRTPILRWCRLSSDPFISGETFRLMADIKLVSLTMKSILKAKNRIESLFLKGNFHVVIFVDLHCTLDTIGQEKIIHLMRLIRKPPNAKISVVFHNHDIVPGADFFLEIKKLSIQCYSPNVLDSAYGVVPIPLGLENRYFHRNGVIRYFPTSRDLVSKNIHTRPVGVFASFGINTNPSERQPVAELAMQYGHKFYEVRIQPEEFRKKLSESLFVLSPPGNGIDCHRTWESIYFGAIPVVMRDKLARSLFEDLPIHVVDDWEEICSLDRQELEKLYTSLVSKTDEKAYYKYWKNLIDS